MKRFLDLFGFFWTLIRRPAGPSDSLKKSEQIQRSLPVQPDRAVLT